MAQLRYLKNVVTLAYDADKCIGCKKCTEVCPHAVFVMEDKKARLVDLDACMECGASAINCSFEAIQVRSGVGCASGILNGILRGTEPTCDCTDGSSGCC